MISVSTAEINAWIAAFIFPLARILATLAAAPPYNNPALPPRVLLILGLAITFAISPLLPAIAVDPASGTGLLVLAQQLVIGFGMGFAMRLVFTAVDMAGTMISLQMGLGFASSYDPLTAGQTGVVSEFLGMLALLIFMAVNGHAMVMATLLQGFTAMPIGAPMPGAATWWNLAASASLIFASGLLLALPIVVTLLIGNLALAVLSRAAPQLNLMAIGFPLTITLGFAALLLGLSHLSAPLLQLFEQGLQTMLGQFSPADIRR
ncbi:MAG TPA: flagellar biosynthetic protein FliR [Accumulibacter sp.]|jgi:flagellar biosynthetic protein FliR|nr:flagellar biosynthetic protein FliR [Accumulibacter sp.]HQC79393.1 flagellar biosynthetic protein FliR [Accumulibacter sp.]